MDPTSLLDSSSTDSPANKSILAGRSKALVALLALLCFTIGAVDLAARNFNAKVEVEPPMFATKTEGGSLRVGVTGGPWPSCIGTDGDSCASMILKYVEDLEVRVVKPGEIVTDDFRTDRVRIYVNDEGIVTKAPSRG